MNARKPVTPPAPKLNRPLASSPEPKNPITTEIMQRVRRVIASSKGLINITAIAEELDISRPKLGEWVACWRSSPSGDNLMAIIRWLSRHDETFVPEIILSRSIQFRGEVESIDANKLTHADRQTIRNSTEPGIVLARRYNVSEPAITHIRGRLDRKLIERHRLERRKIRDTAS